MQLPMRWGVTEDEIARAYPCDGELAGHGAQIFRAVTVHAEPSVVFRWLCQLSVAPYSYDLVDNLGRRSPQTLTPGADQLALGQPMMAIFRLVGFTAGADLTVRMRSGCGRSMFGDLAVTYAVRPGPVGSSRLVAKIVLEPARSRLGRARVVALAWGDLVMMRKQLRTLRDLAQTQAPSQP